MCDDVTRVARNLLHNKQRQRYNGKNILSLQFNITFPKHVTPKSCDVLNLPDFTIVETYFGSNWRLLPRME